jgi:hypothetical protein
MSVRLWCWRAAQLSDSFDDMLWEDVEDARSGSFRFDIPYECEPTGDAIYWRIDLRTRTRLAAATFRVPVHRDERSSPEITEQSLRPRAVAQPPYSRLRLERQPDGAIEIGFPRPGWIWKWWVFTIAVVIAGYAMVPPELRELVVGGALFLVAIILLGVSMTPRRLRAGPDELRMRFLSPFRRPKVMRCQEITDFVPKYDNGARTYYVSVQRAGGGLDPWLMISAADKREAEWLAHELRAAIGR